MLQFLIQNGVDINAQSRRFNSAVHFAAKNGHKEIVEILISSGANDIRHRQRQSDIRNITLLHYSTKNGFADILLTPILD